MARPRGPDKGVIPYPRSGPFSVKRVSQAESVGLESVSYSMPLAVGERLGPYEILALIGAGGMGEVYRAHDTNLARDVAIKVLPAALAQNPDRLARFEREAKVLAAMNHPNIAIIHGLESSATEARAIVMELVEGPTLADRLEKGALPLNETLAIARQIADALEAAHEKGVVHRDLKPANVKVREDGTVKVLDFGLATAVLAGAREPGHGADSPTLTLGATQPGMILGTAAYMAPEQAEGKPVDRRADIWSYGVVLWEMLTGKRLFHADTVPLTLADVLRKELDFTQVPVGTPAPVRELLKRCLDRDVKNRLQWIGEARIALNNAGREPETTATTVALPRHRFLPWAVAGVLGLALLVLAAVHWRSARPVDHPLVRLDVDLGAEVSMGPLSGLGNLAGGAGAILSPDGTRLVYVSRNRLFIRRLDQPKATELVGTEAAFAPFFSPDGQWVAFFAGGKLNKISVDGGAAIALCEADSLARGGSWGEDGSIIAALRNADVLSRIPSAGGAPTPLTELAQGEVTHRWPQVLPGGKAVLFTTHTVNSGFDGASIEVMSLADHRRKTLQRGGTYGRYLATSRGAGHLVYVNKGTLFAVPFDVDALAVRGTPSPVLDQVAYSSGNGAAQFDFSGSGTLLYRGGTAGSGLTTVQWLDSAGRTQPLLAKPGDYGDPKLSPDGQRLLMHTPEGSSDDMWVYEWTRDTMTRLTFGGGTYDAPVWSPDGRYVAFLGPGGMSWTRADGAGRPQPLTQSKIRQAPRSFTPDGKRLAFYQVSPGNGTDLWTVPLESDGAGLRAGKPELFLQTPFNERQPSFSPDGRWLAYSSDESGTYQVYVRSFPDKGGKWQVSNSGGLDPEWSPTGRELFFRSADNRIMVATYTVKGDSFVADKPRIWSDKPILNAGFGRNYDLAPDGKRVVALMPVDVPEAQQAQNHVIFLQNFFDEVRRKVPVGK
jgi:serine/threonine protein kinase/Tol biopolymer transport system component